MELSGMQALAAELEQQISALPAGSITKKTVNGKEYFYHCILRSPADTDAFQSGRYA